MQHKNRKIAHFGGTFQNNIFLAYTYVCATFFYLFDKICKDNEHPLSSWRNFDLGNSNAM